MPPVLRQWWFWGGVAALLVLGSSGGADSIGEAVSEVVSTIIDEVQKGPRCTSASPGADGIVHVAVEELALEASHVVGYRVDLEEYVCARMVRSEEGSANRVTKELLIWAAINDGVDFGPRHGLSASPSSTILWDNDSSGRGLCGTQHAGRRYSTAKDPHAGDVQIAMETLAAWRAGLPDPTGGAVKFVDKRAFGVQPGTRTYEAVAASWAREGLQPTQLEGTPSSLVFFRRA